MSFCKRHTDLVLLLVFIGLTLKQTGAFKPFINVTVFPVGEGEATIIECNEKPDNVSITLINAGSMNSKKGEIELEYFEFIEKKLKSSRHTIKNIILTSSETKHYNFIEPLMNFVEEEDVREIFFYLGGERSSYISLDHVFQSSEKVFEFTRLHEVDSTVGSCGHMDANDNFLDCVKRSSRGPIPKSNQVIPICEHYQANVIAANYGFSGRAARGSMNKEKNGLILKITPSECSSPSFLLGEIGVELEDEDDDTRKYNEFIKHAHSHYLTRSSNVPQSLWDGLKSTLIIVPKNGAPTKTTKDAEFYSALVQPRYGIVSSDISIPFGHPRCSVLRSLDKYVSKYSTKKKKLQCHRRTVKDLEATEEIELSDNLYQTSVVTSDDHLQAQVSFKRIQFTMTQTELNKPVEWLEKRKKQYSIAFHKINKLLANMRVDEKKITVQYIVDQLAHNKVGRRRSNCKKSSLHGLRNVSKYIECHWRSSSSTVDDKKKFDKRHGESDGNTVSSGLPDYDSYTDKIVDTSIRIDKVHHRRNTQNYSKNKTATPLYQQYGIPSAYKKNTIPDKNWGEDVRGLNNIPNEQKSVDPITNNVRYGEDISDPINTMNNEYWEDLNKHSEPNNQEEGDENNLMYNHDEHLGASKHQDDDFSSMRSNNNNNEKYDRHDSRDRLNDQLDDMTMHMRRFNEYPSYHAATEIHSGYSNYQPIPNPDNHNIEHSDDFNYREESNENSYERRKKPTTPHKLKKDRDREDYAFVHGVDYSENVARNSNQNKEEKFDKNGKKTKYLEDDFASPRAGEAMPQRYESVSNEYRPPKEESVLRKFDYDQLRHHYFGVTGSEVERNSHLYTASPTRVSGRITQSHITGPDQNDDMAERSKHKIGTNQEELENPFKPTDHAHNQGQIGELGDDHKTYSEGPSFPQPHQHTTIKATIKNLVKALATMKTWSTPTSESSPSPHFKHYRKGIPTPLLRKKNRHRQQQHFLMTSKPTKSFRESMRRKKTTHTQHKTTSQYKSTKQHATSKHQKTTKHQKSIGTQTAAINQKNTRNQKTTRKKKSTKHEKSISSRGPSRHSHRPTVHSSTGTSTNEPRKSTETFKPSTSPTKGVSEAKHSPLFNKLKSSTILRLPLHDPRVINVLCFGDSLTAGYNKRGKDFFPYCSVLKDMLASKTDIPVNVDIKGIVGEMTHKQMSYRLPLVLGNATSQYDWIIILGGTNDILHVKNFADDQYFLSQLENVWQPRITKDIEKLHLIAYKFDSRTLMLTVPENSIESWPEYRLLRKMRIKINEALKDFAATSQGRTVLCDTAKIVPRKSLPPEEESLLWDDHVHMTRDGYVRMARAVAQCLLPYIPKKKIFVENLHEIET